MHEVPEALRRGDTVESNQNRQSYALIPMWLLYLTVRG